MFEVKKEERVNKTFRLPVDLVNRLSVVAQQNNVSVNELVIKCCNYALENMTLSDGEKDEK